MSSRVHIRPFVTTDGEAVFQMVERLAAEHVWRHALPLDQAYVLRELDVMRQDPTAFGLFVAEADGQLVGLCLGEVGPAHHFLPHVRLVSEFTWWMVPAYRGTPVGARLLLALKAWGRSQQAGMLGYGRPSSTRQSKPGVFTELLTLEELHHVL